MPSKDQNKAEALEEPFKSHGLFIILCVWLYSTSKKSKSSGNPVYTPAPFFFVCLDLFSPAYKESPPPNQNYKNGSHLQRIKSHREMFLGCGEDKSDHNNVSHLLLDPEHIDKKISE